MIGISLEARDHVLHGKSVLESLMERIGALTNEEAGLANDANHCSVETVGDRVYPLQLFQHDITVSFETMKIVNALPPLGDLS